MDLSEKILLIDGHSILNRAFYGLPDLTNSEGQHTGCLLYTSNVNYICLRVFRSMTPGHNREWKGEQNRDKNVSDI